MEYCENGSLDKIVYGGRTMTPSFIEKIIKGTALGLFHLHKNGLIHRDIAVRNILVHFPENRALLAAKWINGAKNSRFWTL